ncbi:MAG: GspE/PulE family protein [Planctomycetota bacterium]|jgi:type IV pilus assembly protein PilB
MHKQPAAKSAYKGGSSDTEKKRLGDSLCAAGRVSRAVVEEAARRSKSTGRSLGDELVASCGVDEGDVYAALAQQRGLAIGDVGELARSIQPHLIDEVPRAFLHYNHLLPLFFDDKGDLTVATCEPDADAHELGQALGAKHVRVLLFTPTNYHRLWTAVELTHGATGLTPRPSLEAVSNDEEDLLASGTFDDESHMIALFEALLLDAIANRASDIHLERYEQVVRVRFRIDGVLCDQRHYHMTPAELLGVINVVKVAADMDIAERRLPQGGRLRRRAGERVFDLRIQTQPAHHGEHMVIRLLHQDKKALTVEDLGFPPELADRYRRFLSNPQGLVLVVGPTGSGKSTTLYAGLQLLAQDESRKVLTIEDPIEYAITNVQQSQAHPQIGFAFADAMRAFVRQDPDVVLVGEIRDPETALEAIRASQTGHLVLSTLHCNDTVDALQRLFDLGMNANSIASELIAVISQRLTRRICQRCRVRTQADRSILAELYPGGWPYDFVCYKGKGCDRCGNGTYGRIALIEFLEVGPEMRRAIARRPHVDALRELARQAGLEPMRDHALRLVHEGLIPLTELPRVLSTEQMCPASTE